MRPSASLDIRRHNRVFISAYRLHIACVLSVDEHSSSVFLYTHDRHGISMILRFFNSGYAARNQEF